MEYLEKLAALSARKQALIAQFEQPPRIYDAEKWDELRQAYLDMSAVANADNIYQRIAYIEWVLDVEHTPLDDTPEASHAWQLRSDCGIGAA